MAACGRKCCHGASKLAEKLGSECLSLRELVTKLNAAGAGGGRLRVRDAHTITGGYDLCYCGQVRQTKAPFPDLTYCHCSVGWYRELFESALGRPVEVEITQSIVCGARTCEFIIRV